MVYWWRRAAGKWLNPCRQESKHRTCGNTITSVVIAQTGESSFLKFGMRLVLRLFEICNFVVCQFRLNRQEQQLSTRTSISIDTTTHRRQLNHRIISNFRRRSFTCSAHREVTCGSGAVLMWQTTITSPPLPPPALTITRHRCLIRQGSEVLPEVDAVSLAQLLQRASSPASSC